MMKRRARGKRNKRILRNVLVARTGEHLMRKMYWIFFVDLAQLTRRNSSPLVNGQWHVLLSQIGNTLNPSLLVTLGKSWTLMSVKLMIPMVLPLLATWTRVDLTRVTIGQVTLRAKITSWKKTTCRARIMKKWRILSRNRSRTLMAVLRTRRRNPLATRNTRRILAFNTWLFMVQRVLAHYRRAKLLIRPTLIVVILIGALRRRVKVRFTCRFRSRLIARIIRVYIRIVTFRVRALKR